MKHHQYVGICMNHTTAHIMPYSSNDITTTTVHSKYTQATKDNTIVKSEKTQHNSQNQDKLLYYKELAAVLVPFTHILLFGNTTAKTELHNHLQKDHHFDDTFIKVINTDKLTENQEHAFVKAYFKSAILV